MLSFMTDFTESLGNIVSVVFFFLCIFLANLVISQPAIKNILKRGGMLIYFAVVLVFGNLIYGAFSFLISDASFFLQKLFQSSFGVSEVFQFLKDLVVIGVFGFGSYLIYRSYEKGAGSSFGKTTLLGLMLVVCVVSLTACSSNYGDPWYQAREFLKTANWVVLEILSAITYLIAGFIAYKAVTSSPIDAALRKLGRIPHVLIFCIFTDMLFGVLYHPVYYFFYFVQGIANQDNFMPIFSYIVGTLLFIGGFVFAYRQITQGNWKQRVPPVSTQQAPGE